MTDEQLAALLAYAGRLDSRVRRALADPKQAAHTIDEWTTVLADVPAALPDTRWDTAHAVHRYYEQQAGNRSAQFRSIEPHDVLAAWTPHRAELLNRHTDPVPAVDADDVNAYRAELAGTRAAVAAGRTPPVQYRAEINPAGQKRLTALTASVGRYLPEHLARELTAYRPRRATREAALADGQPDPYTHPCGWCGAEPEQPCRSGYRARGRGRAARRAPHPCRIDAARRAAEQTEDKHNRLARLKTQPPASRETRARHTTGEDTR